MRATLLNCMALALLAVITSPIGRAADRSDPLPGITASIRPTAARVITLAPHLTELVFAAGAGDKIVATVISSNYPAAARHIPRIGNGLNISVEQIIALKPDLVLAWQPSGAAQTLAPTLTALHIPLVYIAPRQLADIPKAVLKLGRLLGTESVAQHNAGLLQQRIVALANHHVSLHPVSVFIEVGTAPLYTLGDDPLINDALRVCAGKNVYAHAALAAPQISAENVLAARPDAVITSAGQAGGLQERQTYWARLQLPAALHHHIYAINPDELFRPGPRLIDASEELCRDLDRVRLGH
ncbi:MAG: cobalamin-binding protein [Paralcaligenes sp.]